MRDAGCLLPFREPECPLPDLTRSDFHFSRADKLIECDPTSLHKAQPRRKRFAFQVDAERPRVRTAV